VPATITPKPTPIGAVLTPFFSAALGYSISLPSGWRRAVCSPGITRLAPLAATEMYVEMPVEEERIGPGTRFVMVRVVDAQGLTPMAYLERSASQPDVRVEDVSLARSAARAVIASTGATYAYAVTARDWMYHVERPYFGTEDPELESIIATLRILDDATILRTAPTTPTARSIESLADALADALAKKDVSAVAATMEECLTVAAVPGDGGTVSRSAYLKDLAAQFAGGATVQVRARPIGSDPNFGRFLTSTWSRSGQPDQRADFLFKAKGERWSVAAVLYRAP
jgi:hypothetical protein